MSVDALALITRGFLSDEEPEDETLCLITRGWICEPSASVLAVPRGGGGGGSYLPWVDDQVAKDNYESEMRELRAAVARKMAAAIGVAMTGETDALRLAATLGLTLEEES